MGGRFQPEQPAELPGMRMKTIAHGALRRLQRLPATVRGFFGDPQLAYITQAAAGLAQSRNLQAA